MGGRKRGREEEGGKEAARKRGSGREGGRQGGGGRGREGGREGGRQQEERKGGRAKGYQDNLAAACQIVGMIAAYHSGSSRTHASRFIQLLWELQLLRAPVA